MQDLFDIFEFTYFEKASGLKTTIWAREDKTAQKIIDLMNTDSCCYFIPQKRKFKVATKTNRPPYELEQEQLHVAELELEKRQAKHAKEKGN